MRSEQIRNIMEHGTTNFQTSKAFLPLLSKKITFLDFKKERYIIEFSNGLKTDNDGVQSDCLFTMPKRCVVLCCSKTDIKCCVSVPRNARNLK